LRPEGYWVPLRVVFLKLGDNCGYCRARCVGLDPYLELWVKMSRSGVEEKSFWLLKSFSHIL
jgi:hypothetical protein